MKFDDLLEAPIVKLPREAQEQVAQDMERFAALIMKTAGSLRDGRKREYQDNMEEIKYYYKRLMQQSYQ